MTVIAQLRGNKDSRGFKAARIDSKAEKPCRLPVLTIERTCANRPDRDGNYDANYQ